MQIHADRTTVPRAAARYLRRVRGNAGRVSVSSRGGGAFSPASASAFSCSPACWERRVRQQQLPDAFQVGVGIAGTLGHGATMDAKPRAAPVVQCDK